MRTESQRIAWPEFQALCQKGAPLFIAVGAHEEHGPHCSLLTDTLMSHALAERLADALDGLLLPPLSYGECYTTSGYPGTISLRPETLRMLAEDIGHGVMKSGGQSLIFVNGHFGNKAPLTEAAQSLTARGLPAMVLDYPGMVDIAEAVCVSKPPRPFFYHADEFETSIVLALRPDWVNMEKAEPGYPLFPADYDENPRQLLSDFNPNGVFGDPTQATAEKGQRLLRMLTEAALPEVRAFLNALGKE